MTKLFVLLLCIFAVSAYKMRNSTYQDICKEEFAKLDITKYYKWVHSMAVGDIYIGEERYYGIEFNVIKKLPLYYIPEHLKIPKKIGECRTYVIESELPQNHAKVLAGGSLITSLKTNRYDDKIEGTLGIVRKSKDGSYEGITNSHVVLDSPYINNGDKVISPPDITEREDLVVGVVNRSSYMHDCAVIKIHSGIKPKENYIRKIGAVDSCKLTYKEGDLVKIFSPIRGEIVYGKVVKVNATGYFPHLNGTSILFPNLIRLQNTENRGLSVSGDSGSIVLDNTTNSIIAIIKGGDLRESTAIPWKRVESFCLFEFPITNEHDEL